MFLVSSERRTLRSRAIQSRATEIESVLGLRLHRGLTGERRALGLRATTNGLHRTVYCAGALVWTYVAARTVLG